MNYFLAVVVNETVHSKAACVLILDILLFETRAEENWLENLTSLHQIMIRYNIVWIQSLLST